MPIEAIALGLVQTGGFDGGGSIVSLDPFEGNTVSEDTYFLNGMTFVPASNPARDAIVEMTLNDTNSDGLIWENALLLQPPTLNDLITRHGVFPTTRVVKRVDGRDPLVSHGSPMPIYGPFFEGSDTAIKAETGQPVMTSRPIVDLVAYLREIQE